MKRALKVGVALGLSLALSGCIFGSNKDDVAKAPAANTPQAQDSPSWKLVLKKNCKNVDATECVAIHGFTVSGDGKYLVGPSPDGKTLSGQLDADEFGKVKELYAQALPAHLTRGDAATCQALEDEADESTLTIIDQKSDDLLSVRNGETCFHTASLESAQALHDAISTLADKYYALPFPDACAEAVQAVHSLYPSVQSCVTDADCTYVGSNYDVVVPTANQFIETDACTKVKPLVTANTQALQGALTNIRAALTSAQTACGVRMYRDGCTWTEGFQTSVGAPVCQQGACRPNPAVF